MRRAPTFTRRCDRKGSGEVCREHHTRRGGEKKKVLSTRLRFSVFPGVMSPRPPPPPHPPTRPDSQLSERAKARNVRCRATMQRAFHSGLTPVRSRKHPAALPRAGPGKKKKKKKRGKAAGEISTDRAEEIRTSDRTPLRLKT